MTSTLRNNDNNFGSAKTFTPEIHDHEKNEPTLPNTLAQVASNGSVMYAVPPYFNGGPRSGGINMQVATSDELPVIAAKQRGQDYEEVDANCKNRQATTAEDNVSNVIVGKKFVTETRASRSATVTAIVNELTDSDAFDVIKSARTLLNADRNARISRRDTEPSPSTVANYERKCKLIDDAVAAVQDAWASPIALVLSRYAGSKQSFLKMRAAVKWRAIRKIRMMLSAQDAMQVATGRTLKWRNSVQTMKAAIREFREIEALQHGDCLMLLDRSIKRSKSKKDTLRMLKPDWRDNFLAVNDASPTYRAPGLLMRFCGLRPAELEKGVQVELRGNHLWVTIVGAKVRATAGQPWRNFALDANLLPKWFLEEIIAAGGEKTIKANNDNMRAHLARISALLYPRRFKEGKDDIIISGYVFRHALATDLRINHWESEAIAAVLGEVSAETSGCYGSRQYTGSMDVHPVAIAKGSIASARPVRTADRSGLTKILQSAKRQKSKSK